jgi:hypothetical protein
MKKKITAITMSVTIAATMAASAYAAPSLTEAGRTQVTTPSSPALATFSDTANHWGKTAIEWAVSQGIVDGYQDGTFQPDRTLTRAEFTKLVVAALKLSVNGTTSGSDWYLPYVTSAEKAGFSEAFGNWNQPMSRQEMAKMAARASGQNTDDELKWMYLATKAGLIQGTDDTGSLDAEGTTTRAQSVTIIQRILDVKAGKKLEADKRATSRAEVVWHKTNIETMLDGDYIDVAATPEKDRFDPSKLYAEADDGNVKGWSDGLFVVDLDDPNDPYRYLLENGHLYDWDNKQSLDLPSGAYALISVNHVAMKANNHNVSRISNASHLGVDQPGNLQFDYGGKSLLLGNNLQDIGIVEFFLSGQDPLRDREMYSVRFQENTKYDFRLAMVFPKLPGKTGFKTYGPFFNVHFWHFGTYGQPGVDVANYALPESRKAGA